MLYDIEQALIALRKKKPLILCLTNHVTMDFMANCLLSIGAAPIMSEDQRELDELVLMSHAISINMGTLDHVFIERATTAAQLATQHQKPVILDPVGAGATHLRTVSSRSLLVTCDIVRGNASEIMALTEDVNETLGVESTHSVSHVTHSATALAKNHHCTVVVSGEQDFITDGQQENYLTVGSPLMPLVTGMGCTLTAVIAAFRAVVSDAYTAAYLATAYFGLCGGLAASKTDKPGSFRTGFIDELYATDMVSIRNMFHAV